MMVERTAHPGPLADLRVVELCDEKGHFLGKLLSDMGADVIKVEPPGGDGARRVGPFLDDVPGTDRSLFFWHYNTNKRGITLNLDSPEGQELLWELAQGADVIIESMPPGYLAARGLDYAELSKSNPRLIMTSVTLFGQTGPFRDFKGSDLTALALGGPMMSCGYDDVPDTPPIRGGGNQGYQTGCQYAFIGTLLALFERDRSGQGQYVDASIHEALAGTTEGAFPNWEYFGRLVRRQTGRHASASPTLPMQFRTTDGKYLHLMGGLPRSQRSWELLIEWMASEGKAGDLTDPQYRSLDAVRSQGLASPFAAHVMGLIRAFVEGHTSDEAYHGGQQRGMAWAIVRAPEETLDDPHWWDRGFFVQVEHPELAKSFIYPGAPYIFHRTPWQIVQRAPLLGEHNFAVYVRELGLTKERLVHLAEHGVI